MSHQRRHRHKTSYRQNDGKPGVVYILANTAFAENLYKIGQSKHSGAKRARDLNSEATTGTPALFHCVFEQETLNCFQAEQRVHRALSQHRIGKRGQEYFKVSLEKARATIVQVCVEVDREFIFHQSPQASNPASRVYTEPVTTLPRQPNRVTVTLPVQREQAKAPVSEDRLSFSRKPTLWAVILIIATIILSSISSTARHDSSVQPLGPKQGSNSGGEIPPEPAVSRQLADTTSSHGQRAHNATRALDAVGQNSAGRISAVQTVESPISAERLSESAFIKEKIVDASRVSETVSVELTTEERRSLEAACSVAKYSAGPGAYNECLNRQLAKFDPAKRPTGVDTLTTEERRSLEAACSVAKYSAGPGAYNECLNRQLAKFDPARRPTGVAH